MKHKMLTQTLKTFTFSLDLFKTYNILLPEGSHIRIGVIQKE